MAAAQTFSVYAIPTTPSISNPPTSAAFGSGFEATVATNGDGDRSVASTTPAVCTVEGDGVTVSFVGTGTCTLTPSVTQGVLYRGAVGSAQSFLVARAVPSGPTVTNLPSGAVGIHRFHVHCPHQRRRHDVRRLRDTCYLFHRT